MIPALKNARRYLSENIEIVIVPIFFLLIILGVQWLWSHYQLPTQDNLIAIVQGFFLTYGLWVILLASILESMLFIGWYFPGSLVIFLGVAATHGNPEQAVKTVLAVILGMTIGYTFNFILGRYGWHKLLIKFGFGSELKKIEQKVEKSGMFHSFFLYVMPGMGSLLSTAFGVLEFSFTRFLLFTVTFVAFWNTLWGILVYIFGMPLFKLLTNSYVMFVVFCVYFFYMYNKKIKEEHDGTITKEAK